MIEGLNAVMAFFIGIFVLFTGIIISLKSLLGFITLFIIGLFIAIVGCVKYNKQKQAIKHLYTLSNSEFYLLKNAVSEDRTTIKFNTSNSKKYTASGLCNKGILTCKGNIKEIHRTSESSGIFVIFYIPDFIYQHIKKNWKKLYKYIDDAKTEKIYLV